MFSGGEKSRVTLELPKGRFEISAAGSAGDVHEDASLGNALVQDGVWQSVTTTFVTLPHFLKRTSHSGEVQYGFEVDAEKCAEVLGDQSEKFLEKVSATADASDAKSFVGSARFCLNAADIPAAQKLLNQNRFDAVEQLSDVLTEARTRTEENILLLEKGDRTLYTQHSAYELAGLLGESAHVFAFEKGAEMAIGFAKATGNAGVQRDIEEMLANRRPQVYAKHIQKVGKTGMQASTDGDLAAMESSLTQLQVIGDEMVKHMGGPMLSATYLLNDTQTALTWQMKELARRATTLFSSL